MTPIDHKLVRGIAMVLVLKVVVLAVLWFAFFRDHKPASNANHVALIVNVPATSPTTSKGIMHDQ